MTELIPASPTVNLVDGKPAVSSLKVAEHFGKPHKDVLDAIRKIASECPPDFNERNFPPVEYTDAKGEKRPMYNLTRDAFSLLAMGFTGKKAVQWKVRYIEAFNHMEAELLRKERRRLRALPPPRPLISETGPEVLEQLVALKRDFYAVSSKMAKIFGSPFWAMPASPDLPVNKEAFAKSMHLAINHFLMATNVEIDTAIDLFTAFVEAEKLLRAD